jgi:serine/threonine-protein kinase
LLAGGKGDLKILLIIDYNMSEQKGPKDALPDPTQSRAKAAQQELDKFHGAQLAVSEQKDQLVGTTLSGRYRINEKIGEGGMGKIYTAEDERLNKKVVVKVLPSYFAGKDDVIKRFMQEAKMASQIGHENIVDVTDLDKTKEGTPFYVMESLIGEDLGNLIGREGVLAPERIKNIVVQILKALGAAHEKGIVHRDMKPENVYLIERSGNRDFVKLIDFGIAKLLQDAEIKVQPPAALLKHEGNTGLTIAGMVLGTPTYMAPEQTVESSSVDHRADLYAVGIMTYEMLCGVAPFKAESYLTVLEMHRKEAPITPSQSRPDLDIPKEIESVVMKAIKKDPAGRFQSAKEMENALSGNDESLRDTLAPPKADGSQIHFGPRSLEAYLRMKRKERAGRFFRTYVAIGGLILATAGTAAIAAGYHHRRPAEIIPGHEHTTIQDNTKEPQAHQADPPSE